jgi:rhodanese-related sulfurtransferase
MAGSLEGKDTILAGLREGGAYNPRSRFPILAPMEHLTPKATFEYLKENPDAVFIDCRSEMEYMFVGHPKGSMMVPWYDGPDWELNVHFVGQVKKLAGANFQKRPIVLICRSGNRSIEAGEALEQSGFKHVFNVLHGFEGELDDNHHRNAVSGWRVDGLPWEQY